MRTWFTAPANMQRLVIATLAVTGLGGEATAQNRSAPPTRPEGEMRWARYVTLAPAWFNDRVREVELAGASRVRFHLYEPFLDFMTFYGTPATGAGWIVPRKYVERVGDEGFSPGHCRC